MIHVPPLSQALPRLSPDTAAPTASATSKRHPPPPAGSLHPAFQLPQPRSNQLCLNHTHSPPSAYLLSTRRQMLK